MMKLTSWSMGGGERERPESPRGERGDSGKAKQANLLSL
uniref:Uncharacterized protein n=1 Tax=Arundo donax TaxID=35708 RepID=A0A0A9GB80_ARUDO